VVPLRSIEAHLGDRRYSSYSFLTSALEGGEWSASRPGRALPQGKEPPVHIVQEAGWVPEAVWTQRLEEKSSASVGTLCCTMIFQRCSSRHITQAVVVLMWSEATDATLAIIVLISPQVVQVVYRHRKSDARPRTFKCTLIAPPHAQWAAPRKNTRKRQKTTRPYGVLRSR
jgi:hypothetical protein